MKNWLRRIRARPKRPAAAGVAVTLILAALWIRLGPVDPALLDESSATSTVVVDRRGVPLYEALSGDGTRSLKLDAASLPDALVAATLAAEDHRFWRHPGVDPIAIARALKRNLAERAVVEGGSTISQQVAKLLISRRSPGRKRGVRAKVAEAILALRLEHRFTKREILAMYLNLAAYGNQVTGAERASRAYFDRSASMLTTAQAAFLAGLPQRPSSFNPFRNPESAITRQRVVLRRMRGTGLISEAQATDARAERLSLSREPSRFLAPHFVEMVLAATTDPKPARIQTTLDAALQADVAGIVRSHRAMLTRHGAANVSVVVLHNQTGQWLAWEGSGDYFDAPGGGAINGPTIPRQPGSALKPFTYALAFEEGFTPASVLADVPSHFPTAENGIVYSPRNYDGRFLGPMRARRALAGSQNVPAVALASELGVPALLRFLARAGFSTLDKTASYYGLGVTLGNAEVRLDELVAAYATFARGGDRIEPSFIPGSPAVSRPIVSRQTAFWITDVLADPEAREYTFGRGGSLEFPFPVAVKTGTSQAYHDNWTVGYTGEVTVGVWVGNFDRKPLRNSSGVTGAAPIFHAVMMAAVKRTGARADAARAIVSVPPQLVNREICGLSGMAANAWCPARQREWLARDGEALPCSWHHMADEGLLVVLPPEFRSFSPVASVSRVAFDFSRKANDLPPQGGSHIVRERRLAIVNPPSGATYLIDPTLRREFQTLPLRVVARTQGNVEWRVNAQRVGTSSSDDAFHWPLTPGRHTISARHSSGETAEAVIIVR